jgi:hypothetical protein
MEKLFFASLWSKMSSNGIETIESTLNKLYSLSKKLTKYKKDIETGSKTAKTLTILVGNLLVTSIFLTVSAVTGIPALLGAKVLSKMVNIIIPIAKKLSKNNKHIIKAVGSAIILTTFTGLMSISSLVLSTIALTGIPALLGAKLLDWMVDIIIPITKKLSKNNKHISNAVGSAIILTAFTGLMAISSLVLATIALTGIPALLGAKLLDWMVDIIIPIAKKLSKNNKHIIKAVGSAVLITAFSGLMAITSLLLSSIAKTGLDAMLGAVFTLGFVTINLITFTILSKTAATIIKGSIVMAIMSVSLLIFGTALGKISDATKDMSWKQVGMIGTLTVSLGLAVAALGIPIVAGFILLGSAALGAMSGALYIFAKSLKIISDMGEVPTKTLNQVLNAMKTVRNFFAKNGLGIRAVANAMKYTLIMIPFGSASKKLAKLKEVGSVPIKLVYQTLNAMKAIGSYYTENPIGIKAIIQARRYKSMMKPFGKTIKHLSKLKKLGSVPIKLVYQTLNAMKAIANYYVENPIERNVIKQSRRYKRMMKPFGKTIGYLSKLKKLGSIPMKLVYQTLNAMSAIANYYIENPIERKAIKQARRYKRMLKPFGNIVENLSKLKEIGSIPMKLVQQTLNAISTISEFYLKQDVGFLGGIKANIGSLIITNNISSFGKAVKYLKELKDLQTIPTKSIESAVIAISSISNFYNTVTLSNFIEIKSKFTEMAVDKFTIMAKKIQDKFTNIKLIDHTAITSIVNACQSIINFYSFTLFLASEKKIQRINNAVERFSEIAKVVKSNIQDFTKNDFTSVKFAVKSMKRIIRFLKSNTLNNKQRKRARKNINLLKSMASAMSSLSNMNQTNLSSIGDALSNALNGVSTVDLGQVQAVTNMFNAFNGINKSENIINKFTETIKEFTSTCKNLMDAMNFNTDAINNMDTSGINGSYINENRENNIIEIGANNTSSGNGGVHITNVDEIARTIAEKINGVLSVDVPDTQVQLLINGTGGNEWTISRY